MITIGTVRLPAIKLLHACSQQENIYSPVKINHLYNPPVLERFGVCIGEISLLKRLAGPVGLYSYTQHAYSINSIPPSTTPPPPHLVPPLSLSPFHQPPFAKHSKPQPRQKYFFQQQYSIDGTLSEKFIRVLNLY